MSDAIQELSGLLARLPGIGKRTAQRLTFHLLKSPPEYSQGLGEAIASIHERICECNICCNLSDGERCSVCADHSRVAGTICVVASVPDLWAIEQTGAYRGVYHVLHGLFAPLDGIGPEDLRLELLEERVRSEIVEEVIVATPPSVEGEATATLIRQALEGNSVKVSRIASGIPFGGELEFIDGTTLGRALADRRGL